MLFRAAKNNGLVGVALVLGDLAVVPGSFFGLAFCLPIDSLCLSSRLLWPLWQDSRAMYSLFADCTKKGASLAAFLCRGPRNHTWGEDLANARRCAGLSAPAGKIRVRAV